MFLFFLFVCVGGGGVMNMNTILSKSIDYQTAKKPLQSLRYRQSKLISSIYVPEEAIIHNYMPEEAMKSWL